MQRTSNKTILEFNKVAYADYYFENQYGIVTLVCPKWPTLFGATIDPTAKIYKSDELVLDRARRRGSIDRWIPMCRFQLSNNHSVTYTGEKATDMHKAWCAHVFGGKKKKAKKDTQC